MASNLKREPIISTMMIKLHRDVFGRGPEDVRVYMVDDLLIVRLKGALTTVEKNLSQTDEGEQIIKQLRHELRKSYYSQAEQSISTITGRKVVSSHGDINTKTGERIEVFVLD